MEKINYFKNNKVKCIKDMEYYEFHKGKLYNSYLVENKFYVTNDYGDLFEFDVPNHSNTFVSFNYLGLIKE